MPNYEFEYVDDKGQVHYFEQWVDANRQDIVSEMKSPCGQYSATRLWSAAPMQMGMTSREKIAGTTKYRKEFTTHAKLQREERKKNAEPGSREHVSNELWTGNESFKNVLSAEPKGGKPKTS